MSNNLDKQYQNLLQDIIDNGVRKGDRTGTGTISVFGRQIRHKMSDGFPLLTTKKMHWDSIAVELLWFLRGQTNIKPLIAHGCNIWNGDAYKKFKDSFSKGDGIQSSIPTQKEFIEKIKTIPSFAEKWGDLGPIYGKQWRNWEYGKSVMKKTDELYSSGEFKYEMVQPSVDQINVILEQLANNPDSRRMMVNAWNVGELDKMTLPPCHYGFQVWTREMSYSERLRILEKKYDKLGKSRLGLNHDRIEQQIDKEGIPKREISLMWNQRSVDTFLGLPFNIASYGLLLQMLADEMNMVAGELIEIGRASCRERV